MSKLFIVATPIGNLGDITLRASQTLNRVDLVLCEDTRTSGILLSKLGVKKPLLSLHDNNEVFRIPQVLERLNSGQEVALISESGTPLISDPGYKMVREVIKQGLKVESIPGPTSLITALTVSGLPPDKFFFVGFLPKKEGDLRKLAQKISRFWQEVSFTMIAFESPHRLKKSLETLSGELDNPYFVIARELTKVHEELIRGNFEEIVELLDKTNLKGEIVLLINPKKP